MIKKRSCRVLWALLAVALFAIEVLIAVFVRDDIIRPYGGDVLVTLLIGCAVRVVFPRGIKLLPFYVFVFASAVEVGQYFDFVSMLGLDRIEFFRVLLGQTFSPEDIVCYAIGCVIFMIIDQLIRKNTN